jgi:MFS family permease
VPHTLIGTLRGLRGNARGAVLTEPLWGIPYNLFAPYASIYMVALGLTDRQVGLVTSVSLAGQAALALVAGVITDRLGRKRATLIFDILSWSVPCLIWAAAQNIVWFLVAGLVNSLRRVPDISWTCILVEDTDPEDLTHIYAWVYIAGQLSAFFAPLAGLLVQQFTLVPAVRALYLLAFAMMTAKFLILNTLVTETRQGRVRMEQTRGKPIRELLGEYGGVVRHIIGAPHTVYTIALMAILSIVTTVQGTFWSILATERVRIPAGDIAIFPFARSMSMLACLFFVVPRLRQVHFGRPMLLALAGYVASQLVLVCAPVGGYGWLICSTLLDSFSYAVVATQTERLTVINVDAAERARIVSLAHVTVIGCTTPFGWIAGALSQANKALPFVLNAALLTVAAWVVARLMRTAPNGGDPPGESAAA